MAVNPTLEFTNTPPTQRTTATGPTAGPLATNANTGTGSSGGTVKPGTRTPPGSTGTTTTAGATTGSKPVPASGRTNNSARGITPETAQAGTSTPGYVSPKTQEDPGTLDGYIPTGNGGGEGGSSAPSIDTTADPYAAENAAAAATTKRIVNGVDLTDKINEANTAWSQATQGYGEQANNILGQYQQGTEGNIGAYQGNANAIIDQLKGLTGQQLAEYANSTGQTIDQATAQINNILAGMQQNMGPAEAGRVGRVDTVEEENLLQQIVDSQKQESQNAIDYNVQKATNELQRAQEDAQAQFQAQRDQIAGQERTARDNSALYSEMRGDRGGIGKAQYDAIANTAATNQLTVNKEQTKLATDTARQIADLRAQGEFTKAEEMLKITQSYLAKLMELKQWADQTNVSIDEFNIGVDQWEQEYNNKIQQALGEMGMNAVQYTTGLNLDRQQYLTGQGINAANTEAQQRLGVEGDVNKQRQNLNDALASYGLSNAKYMSDSEVQRITGILSALQQNAQNMASTELAAANVTGALSDSTPTMANREAQADRLAQAGAQMLAQGITPTDAQLKALGWSKDQYQGYKAAMDAAAAAAAAAARRGGGRTNLALLWPEIQDYVDSGIKNEEIERRINNAVASGKYSDASTAQSNWAETSKTYSGWRSLPDT